MPETKTVELPLTRSEQRHLDNARRQAEKRRRAAGRDDSREQRDLAIKAVNEEYGAKIAKLQTERKDALKKVWDQWREMRAKA